MRVDRILRLFQVLLSPRVISLLLCMLIHLSIPPSSYVSRAIGLVCTLSIYSLARRRNLLINRIPIENQERF